jgi:hypothetical protein
MPQVPHANEGLICPLHRKDMSEVCHKCPWWTRVMGKHPQTEEMIDDWRCAISWMPVMLVENAQMQRSTAAAVETFRNGVVESVFQAVGVAAQAAQQRIMDQGRLVDASINSRSRQ